MIRLPDDSARFQNDFGVPADDFTDDPPFDLDDFAVDYIPDPEPELDLHHGH